MSYKYEAKHVKDSHSHFVVGPDNVGVKAFDNSDAANSDADDRNARAKEMKLKARYRVEPIGDGEPVS